MKSCSGEAGFCPRVSAADSCCTTYSRRAAHCLVPLIVVVGETGISANGIKGSFQSLFAFSRRHPVHHIVSDILDLVVSEWAAETVAPSRHNDVN